MKCADCGDDDAIPYVITPPDGSRPPFTLNLCGECAELWEAEGAQVEVQPA